MTVVKRCQLCDSALEMTYRGATLSFTAHDQIFCRAATIDRIALMKHALDAQADAFKAAAAEYRRQVDAMLSGHGLPTTGDMADVARMQAAALTSTAINVEGL